MEHGNSKALEHALWMLEQGYLSINEEGEIWRHAARNGGRWKPVIPRRAENVGGKGYLRLTLQIDGKLQSVMAHRVVWTYLVGSIPEKQQINHKDLDKQNNRLSNLEVMSGHQNIQHSHANGRRLPWSDAQIWRGKTRTTFELREEIRADRAQGFFYIKIAAKFSLSITHIQRICTSKD